MDGKETKDVGSVSELDALLDNMGTEDEEEVEVDVVDEDDEVTEEDDVDVDVDEDEEATDSDDEETEEDEEPEEDESKKTKKPAKKQPKDHHAFAAMRKQNKQLQEAIDNLARGLGIDPKEDDALSKLNDLAYNGIAKRSGRKKEEVIADSKAQKELQAYRQKDIQRHAADSFARIKDEFGVDNGRLTEFAKKASEQGYQLLGQKEDWVGLYKNIYFDEIVQQQVDKAVEEALKRDEAADKNSGKSKKRSKGGAKKKEISSVAELDKILDKL